MLMIKQWNSVISITYFSIGFVFSLLTGRQGWLKNHHCLVRSSCFTEEKTEVQGVLAQPGEEIWPRDFQIELFFEFRFGEDIDL